MNLWCIRLVAASATLLPVSLYAQAKPTVKNVHTSEFGVYASYSRSLKLSPNIWGGTIGVYKPIMPHIAVDVRATALREGEGPRAHLALGGVRIFYPLQRLTPYLEVLAGLGRVNIPGGVHGNGFAYSGLVGADYALDRRWAVRGEFQQSRSNEQTTIGVRQYSFGVVYKFGQ